MPALNFQARNAPLVASGVKRRTIRAWRKRPFRKGDVLYLITGARTKACRRLLPPQRCRRVREIEMARRKGEVEVRVEGRPLGARALQALARADGFSDAEAFLAFFARVHGFPFRGQMIEW